MFYAILIGPHEKIYVAPVQAVFLVFFTEVRHRHSDLQKYRQNSSSCILRDERERHTSAAKMELGNGVVRDGQLLFLIVTVPSLNHLL